MESGFEGRGTPWHTEGELPLCGSLPVGGVAVWQCGGKERRGNVAPVHQKKKKKRRSEFGIVFLPFPSSSLHLIRRPILHRTLLLYTRHHSSAARLGLCRRHQQPLDSSLGPRQKTNPLGRLSVKHAMGYTLPGFNESSERVKTLPVPPWASRGLGLVSSHDTRAQKTRMARTTAGNICRAHLLCDIPSINCPLWGWTKTQNLTSV